MIAIVNGGGGGLVHWHYKYYTLINNQHEAELLVTSIVLFC
jgi:hypothetical protein